MTLSRSHDVDVGTTHIGINGTTNRSCVFPSFGNQEMAQPAWKRLGSPIGKKGPRKANPKISRRSREPWTPQEVRELRSLTKGNTPTGVLQPKLQRPPPRSEQSTA